MSVCFPLGPEKISPGVLSFQYNGLVWRHNAGLKGGVETARYDLVLCFLRLFFLIFLFVIFHLSSAWSTTCLNGV